ncbi:hypothetical protein Taro_031987 [Colocasia esculenta]|uniref:Phytocyanin domain-containing protein n=1 Tax=Colocasia esculenta TaxID=4460 RepID=A0A843VY25_COLES|nr:hypothetical protein [Colocasia esculenta]
MERRNGARRRDPLLFPNLCRSSGFFLFFFSFCCLALLGSHGAEGYKNYTVGDDLGWYDKLMVPLVNYQKWVEGKNFSLGDFLIFNTDKNHSVVQTYNVTTYRRCDYNNADVDDTTEWSAGDPTVDRTAVSVAVPLVKEGMNYFFSGHYDGEQCKHGQHFKIKVAHGQGLPESLRAPAATTTEAPAPDSPDDIPENAVPANFNNPTEVGAVKESLGRRRCAVGTAGLLALAVPVLWGLVLGLS